MFQFGERMRSVKSQDFWLPVMDYPRALDSSPEDRGLGVRDCISLCSKIIRSVSSVTSQWISSNAFPIS